MEPGSLFYAEAVRGHLFIQWGINCPITSLTIGGQVWMTDEPQYVWCLQSFAERSFGNVLVAGLGLGLVVHFLAQNPKVDRVTVIEIDQGVIGTIGHYLPPSRKIRVINDNFYWFLKGDTKHRDVVIWDLAVWGQGDVNKIGLDTMAIMPILCETQYGPDTVLFRHGFDRDPTGHEFIHNHPELVDQAKEFAFSN